MSAETKVYQVTYLQDGRTVLIGDEIMSIDTAQRFLCARGHKLRVIYRKADNAPNVWWLDCLKCGPQTFVRRYERILDPKNATTRLARLAKADKAPPELIERTNHHTKPFASLDAAIDALIREEEGLDGIKAAMEAMVALEMEG